MSEPQEFIKDPATGQNIPLIRVKPNLKKTQRIWGVSSTLGNVVEEKPGIRENEALSIIKEYEKIKGVLERIDDGGKIGRVRAFFLKRKLHSLAVREFNLWKSMPSFKNIKGSTEVVSFTTQRNLDRISTKISEEMVKLRDYDMLPKGFIKGIYRFKLSKLSRKKPVQHSKK